MIATVRTLGSQAGTQGRARGWAVGPLRLNNEARFFLLLFTHTHTRSYCPTLNGSEGTEHCDYEQLAMKN